MRSPFPDAIRYICILLWPTGVPIRPGLTITNIFSWGSPLNLCSLQVSASKPLRDRHWKMMLRTYVLSDVISTIHWLITRLEGLLRSRICPPSYSCPAPLSASIISSVIKHWHSLISCPEQGYAVGCWWRMDAGGEKNLAVSVLSFSSPEPESAIGCWIRISRSIKWVLIAQSRILHQGD